MTTYRRSYASQAASSLLRITGCSETVTGAVRALELTVADAFYAYALTGSAFATLVELAVPHLEIFIRCLFHGKG